MCWPCPETFGFTPLLVKKVNGSMKWMGTGRLTKSKIYQLQVYYGRAIRNNTHDIQSIQDAVMAIWFHTHSTDDNLDHDLCPPGENSWCGFQRDLEKGTSDYEHAHPLPGAVANTIHPVMKICCDIVSMALPRSLAWMPCSTKYFLKMTPSCWLK